MIPRGLAPSGTSQAAGRATAPWRLRVTNRTRAALLPTDTTVWCAMGIAHFRRIDRRRMVRVALCVPLIVHQETETQEKFPFRARTLSVNGYGALLQCDAVVSLGDRLRLFNEISRQSIESRVSSMRRERDEKIYVGVEFASANAKFWNMTFPRPGERPLRRIVKTAL